MVFHVVGEGEPAGGHRRGGHPRGRRHRRDRHRATRIPRHRVPPRTARLGDHLRPAGNRLGRHRRDDRRRDRRDPRRSVRGCGAGVPFAVPRDGERDDRRTRRRARAPRGDDRDPTVGVARAIRTAVPVARGRHVGNRLDRRRRRALRRTDAGVGELHGPSLACVSRPRLAAGHAPRRPRRVRRRLAGGPRRAARRRVERAAVARGDALVPLRGPRGVPAARGWRRARVDRHRHRRARPNRGDTSRHCGRPTAHRRPAGPAGRGLRRRRLRRVDRRQRRVAAPVRFHACGDPRFTSPVPVLAGSRDAPGRGRSVRRNGRHDLQSARQRRVRGVVPAQGRSPVPRARLDLGDPGRQPASCSCSSAPSRT